ncbi:MAG: GNAT family N-acetyltransferase [SAR202 cluster bacterium]|nr:GNAT family N-acetyltransferase [SAR202 cluster bacterium]
MFPEVVLSPVSRNDVGRLAEWLKDPAVNSSWYGVGPNGRPLHMGYDPQDALAASEEEWARIFSDEDRKLYSIRTADGEHIGEGQLVIEWPLQEARLFLLIGRKDLWHHHYGTAALIKLLDQAFRGFQLHRVWADIPDYNTPAQQMFSHLGFVLEGHLRGTHWRDGQWYDSRAMGLLAEEYERRRARLLRADAQQSR